MANILPQIMYYAFDLLNKGRLSGLYEQVKHANGAHKSFNKQEVSDFLSRWQLDTRLEQNPLMNKDDLKKHISSINPKHIHSWAYTGGSYGEPLRVPYSKKRALIRTATFKYFNEIGGYSLGDPFVLIRAKSRPALVKFLRNENIFIPNDISEDRVRAFIRELKDKRIKVIVGYPTVMYELALYLHRYPEQKEGLRVKALISASEPLEDFKRQTVKDAFGCSFIDRYSNEEVGLIAQQKRFGEEYYVNKFGVIVEVVHEHTLQPVKEGEIGKVVVTDLYNELIPVVRYDTGDLAMVHKYQNGELLSIKNIAGRVTEQITAANGVPVSSLMLGPYIYKPLSKIGKVCQYQFAQTGKHHYELRLKASEGQVPDNVLQEMQQDLSVVLGAGSEIKILLVNDIKPQPSGKRPVFKNEYVTAR